jgi:hypothetical protein
MCVPVHSLETDVVCPDLPCICIFAGPLHIAWCGTGWVGVYCCRTRESNLGRCTVCAADVSCVGGRAGLHTAQAGATSRVAKTMICVSQTTVCLLSCLCAAAFTGRYYSVSCCCTSCCWHGNICCARTQHRLVRPAATGRQ